MPKTLPYRVRIRLDRHMTNYTETAHPLTFDTLDLYDGRILGAMLDREAEDRDWSPVPDEYRGLWFGEVCDLIREEWAEEAAARKALDEIPHRWQ